MVIPTNSAVGAANPANVGNGSVRSSSNDYVLPSDLAAGWGAAVGAYDAAKFPKYTIQPGGYPLTTDLPGKMLIGYAGNADRYETWQSNDHPAQDTQQPFIGAAPLSTYPVTATGSANTRNVSTGYLITGQLHGDQGVHTGTDIPLSAYGRGAMMFSGVMDNTDVFFKIGQAVLGGSK